MARGSVVKAKDVMPFVPPGFEGQFTSTMLLDGESCGSTKIVVNHFRLKGGGSTPESIHQAPYDEVYYVLSGQALLVLDGVEHIIEKDTIVFIPGGTPHSLCNKSETEDYVMLSIWPLQPEPGAHELYDTRKKMWGTSFRKL